MSVHPPGSVKLLQTPEVTWLGTVMLVDGVNEKETKEIIENKKEAEKQSTAIFNADKERDKKKGALFLLRYHLFRGFEMFLNSWHSRVINWKWNRNLKGFYGAFTVSMDRCKVPPFTGKQATATLFRSEFPLQLPLTLSNTSHTLHTQTCSSGTLSAPQVIEECAYRTCVPYAQECRNCMRTVIIHSTVIHFILINIKLHVSGSYRFCIWLLKSRCRP